MRCRCSSTSQAALHSAGVADQHRHDMARRRHHRQAGLGQPALHARDALLVPRALGLALLQVADRGQRAGRQRRRQRGREDEAGRVAAQEIDQRGRAGDIAAHHAERLGQRALDHRRPVRDAVALGDAAAARRRRARPRAPRRDRSSRRSGRRRRTMRRSARCRRPSNRPIRSRPASAGSARQRGEQALEIVGVVVAEDVLLGAAVADAGDHRGVVAARPTARPCRASRAPASTAPPRWRHSPR